MKETYRSLANTLERSMAQCNGMNVSVEDSFGSSLFPENSNEARTKGKLNQIFLNDKVDVILALYNLAMNRKVDTGRAVVEFVLFQSFMEQENYEQAQKCLAAFESELYDLHLEDTTAEEVEQESGVIAMQVYFLLSHEAAHVIFSNNERSKQAELRQTRYLMHDLKTEMEDLRARYDVKDIVNDPRVQRHIWAVVPESLSAAEKEMIHNLFDFGDSEAKEIMIPRIDMTFVSKDATYQEVIEIFKEDKFTRLPVYEETTDNVVGILNMKDLLLCEDPNTFSIDEIMREPYFTFEHKNTADLFMEMRKSSISLAVVLDEYGVTAGMITLEDLLEEIVGEIRDEYDTDEEDAISQISDREYLVLGSTNLDDVNDELGTSFQSDDYDTIGGYCLELLDHLPECNEITFAEDGTLLKIMAMDKNRIHKVSIKLPSSEEEEHT